MKLILSLLCLQFSVYLISGELKCNGPHEYLYEYTPVCPLVCGSLHQMRCLALMQKPSCQCKDGFIRDTKANKCVHLNECPTYYEKEPLVCSGEHERYAEVVSACPATCIHPGGPICMALIHKPSCVCADGTIRDTVNNRCVKKESCPQKGSESMLYNSTQIVCNGPNEQFAEWISACPSVCPKSSLPSPPSKCLAIIHKPSCVCTTGTIRDTINNRCVKANECPKVEETIQKNYSQLVCTGQNEHISTMTSCHATCQRPWTPLCDIVADEPECVCDSGTIRDSVSGKCVHKKDCPNSA